jgi:crotonobetainyl-CoA:carnitine CoA-transferase CaiB-like acyl-CoA transferase
MPSMGAAFLVALGALAALSARERTGAGQHVRTSLFQGALLFTTQIWQEVERANAGYHEIMAKTYPPGVHQQMVFECAGGEWIHVSIMSGLPPTCSLDEVIGLEGADRLSPERRRERFRAWNRAELLDALRRNNHAADAITPAGDLFDHPQTVANGMIVAVEDPDKGATTQLGVPIHLLGTPGAVTGPQPRAGEHTEEVLAGADRPAPARVRPPSPGGLALDGIRVLDFGQYLAGPFGPMILGDLGAQVIKVEPVTGDGMRLAGKPFVGCQRGKRSLALDLKAPAGLGVAHRLIASADVVHHNMTRGVAAKLGIDYGACRSLRADIVYCNTYAYGLPDPLGRFGGLDPLYQASAGLEYEAGAVHAGNPPLYLRFGMCDTSNALLSAVGVLLALFHRQHTGEGQELWTSLHDGGLFFSSDVWLGPDGQTWDRPHLDADLTGLSALYRLYRTQDDDWICLAAEDETHWPGLCRALGQPALADDPRFASVEDRCRHRADLESRLGALFLERTARYWTRTLDDHGVPNERPVDTFDGRTVLHDDDNVRLGLVAEYDHPVLGRLRQFGQLIDLSATPGRIWGPPPLVGQHSREILRGVGLLDGDIDALVASGVVYEPDANYLDRFRN